MHIDLVSDPPKSNFKISVRTTGDYCLALYFVMQKNKSTKALFTFDTYWAWEGHGANNTRYDESVKILYPFILKCAKLWCMIMELQTSSISSITLLAHRRRLWRWLGWHQNWLIRRNFGESDLYWFRQAGLIITKSPCRESMGCVRAHQFRIMT